MSAGRRRTARASSCRIPAAASRGRCYVEARTSRSSIRWAARRLRSAAGAGGRSRAPPGERDHGGRRRPLGARGQSAQPRRSRSSSACGGDPVSDWPRRESQPARRQRLTGVTLADSLSWMPKRLGLLARAGAAALALIGARRSSPRHLQAASRHADVERRQRARAICSSVIASTPARDDRMPRLHAWSSERVDALLVGRRSVLRQRGATGSSRLRHASALPAYLSVRANTR